jgi:hypothetical protein
MVSCYRLPAAGGKGANWVVKHCKNRMVRYVDCNDNICFWTALSFFFYPEDQLEKRVRDETRIKQGKEIMLRYYDNKEKVYNNKFLREYEGFNLDELFNVSEKLNVSIFIYQYNKEFNNYSLDEDNRFLKDGSEVSAHILLVYSDDMKEAHYLPVINHEKLTGSKICLTCGAQWFDMKDNNYKRKYDAHVKKCEKNNGKIVKGIKLDKISRPFIPHLYSNKASQEQKEIF